MLHMPSGIYPEVSFPQIAVIVETPALGIRDVETVVTRPIEERVSIVPGVSRLQSKTVRGASEIKIDFAPGTDMVQALNDVRAKMSEIEAQLPAGATAVVERQSPSVFPIISFVVTGGANPSALRDFAYYDLRPRIGRLDDVSYVDVQGGDLREIVVEIDPQRLVETGISITDLADHLAKDHQLKAVGRLDRGSTQFQVLSDSQAIDPLDLADRVIAVKNDESICLRDVGRVIVSHEDRSMAIRCNGEDAVSLTVFRRLGGNALAVSHELNDALAEARRTAPPGIAITPVYDQGQLVRTAIDNVRDAMLIGGAMSVLVLLAFLKSVRATLIAALSIPLSLIISFGFLRLTGDTLNLMSLGGLAVAIGLIIDDTVVVIENIARHLATGQTGDAAVDAASKEISGAVVGSTLTTILVFVPLAFVHGVVGQFFQSLSIALSIALLVSMVVSLTIIPVLASKFLAGRPMPSTGPIYDLLAAGYETVLRGSLKMPRLVIVLALAMVVPGWLLFRNLDSGFMPDMDEGAFILDYEMPVGTSLAQTDKILRRVEAVLQDTPDISGYIRRTGAENGLFVTESFRGDILVSLKPPGQRRPMNSIFDSLQEEIHKAVPELETLELMPLVKDQMNDLAGLQRPIEIKVFGPDVAELRKLAEQVKSAAEALKLDEVNAHVHLGNPDLVVRPNNAQLSRLGLSVQDVENQLNAALFGQVVGTIPQRDRLTNIRVRFPDRVRYDRDELDHLPIGLPAATGTSNGSVSLNGATAAPPPQFVSLGQVASIELVRSPNEFWRENQQPVITVTAEQGDIDLGTINRQLETAPVEIEISARLSLGTGRRISGAARLVQKFADGVGGGIGIGVSVAGVSIPQPDVAAVDFSDAADFTGQRHVCLVDYAYATQRVVVHGRHFADRPRCKKWNYFNRVHRPTVPLRLAAGRIVGARWRTRFRPIVMTSLTTIFGLVPLALGLGPGAQMQQPLAIAVIGGLIANMLVTRLLIPVGYLALRRNLTAAPGYTVIPS